MPNPKKKHSYSRTHKKRNHQHPARWGRSRCPNCGNIKVPHLVCPTCGTYRDREVIPVES
ncbi:MAG: 50S ribosomal protein L32 [Nitrospirae bacterium]|nr:50S ribosomal protein L32 [Nitrospirota bacterium]